MLQFLLSHTRTHAQQFFYLISDFMCRYLCFFTCILKYYTHLPLSLSLPLALCVCVCFVFIISDFQLWTLQLHKLNSVCCNTAKINHKLKMYYCRFDMGTHSNSIVQIEKKMVAFKNSYMDFKNYAFYL